MRKKKKAQLKGFTPENGKDDTMNWYQKSRIAQIQREANMLGDAWNNWSNWIEQSHVKEALKALHDSIGPPGTLLTENQMAQIIPLLRDSYGVPVEITQRILQGPNGYQMV